MFVKYSPGNTIDKFTIADRRGTDRKNLWFIEKTTRNA